MSAYLESRAELAKSTFFTLTSWSAPPCWNLDGPTVKNAIISGGGQLILETMLKEGALRRPQDDAVLDAIKYLDTVFNNSEVRDGGHGVRERVFANIFDAVLAAMKIGGTDGRESQVFRGQYDSRWKLAPSYYRASPVRAEHLKLSVLNGQLDHLRQIYPHVDFAGLSSLQQEAVVQHYFSGTELLDFTTSMYVAAFFATSRDESIPAAPMGAIYRISRRDIADLMLAMVESPTLPPEFRRIHRQHGVFLRIKFRQAINDPGLFDRWVFNHTDAGREFVCDELGISGARLLAKDITAEDAGTA
jgi:hypothetical protein